MSEQDGRQATIIQRPPTNDPEAWKTYWETQSQPWRTEPEVDTERQKYLAERRAVTPDIEQGIYPFKDIKLSRADVEWLLVTHENGRGPVDWNEPSQRNREGLDLRGANLSEVNLRGLPLARLQGGLVGEDWILTTTEQQYVAAIHLEKASLTFARLEGSILTYAHLQGTSLNSAHLESADVFGAHCESPVPGTWRRVYFDAATKLGWVRLANDKHVGVRLLDVHWGGVNLTGIDWTSVQTLFYEHRARHKTTDDGKWKDRRQRTIDCQEAARAYHQLSIVLQQQGLNDDAARFTYRAQLMQRKMYWYQGKRKVRQYLFSLFLDLLAGYGYKPWRSFLAYLIVITVFATGYFIIGRTVGPTLSPLGSFVFSMTSFHGRGFFPGDIGLDDPLTVLAALEAFLGLMVEVTFIATLTQRLFGK